MAAETRAAGFSRAAFVHAVEAFGQACQVFGRNARTSVLHAEDGAAVVEQGDGYIDGAARWGVSNCVLHEVAQRALQLCWPRPGTKPPARMKYAIDARLCRP